MKQLTKKIERFQKIVQMIMKASNKQSTRVLNWATEFDGLAEKLLGGNPTLIVERSNPSNVS